jgi:hypothetical protein
MLQTTYRAAAGAFTAICVVMQYWLLLRGETFADMAASSVKFFSFFTILTNLLAAAALLLPVIAPNSTAGQFLNRPNVRTAITGYIIIVGVVYWLLLSGLSHRQGWPMFFEHMAHYVTPPLFVLDWVLFVPKRDVDGRVAVGSLWYPLVYLVWTLLHGAVTGWYPYPFVDVADLGYPRVFLNIAGLVLAFLILEAALVGISRMLARRGAPAK